MAAKIKKETTSPPPELRPRSAPIIERAPLPIVEVQGSMHLVSYVNSAFCSLLEKPRKDLIGKPFAEIVPGGDECVPILDRVYQTGEAVTLAKEDESEPAHWLYAIWPALDEEGSPVGVIIQLTKSAKFRQNITEANEALLIAGLRQHELIQEAELLNEQLGVEIAERKQMEEALHQSRKEITQHAEKLEKLVAERTTDLKESIKSLENLNYTMAHDLRAPIRAMRGLTTSLLEDVPLDETGKSYAKKINKAAERMDQLINDLLDYGELTHLDFPIHALDLNTQVEKTLSEHANEIQNARARIHIQEAMPSVSANETLLQQIFSNLILNALKFVTRGAKPKIHVRAEKRHSKVRVWVEDNGLGIAAQYHDKIFGVFQRLHTTEEFPGTGVGLAIVKRAAERMGGCVGVESEPGRGSKFWIELPEAT